MDRQTGSGQLAKLKQSVQRRINESLGANYPVPLEEYARMARRIGIVRSLVYSRRLNGRVIVGRRTRVRVARTAEVTLAPGAILLIGLAHEPDLPTSVVLEPAGRLEIEGRVQIMRGSSVTVNWGAKLSIGGGTYFNDGCRVYCADVMLIGRDCAISWGCTLSDSDVHVLERPDRRPAGDGVKIGDGCWLGAGTVVLKDTTIGDGAVIGAGSVVSRDVPSRALAAGVPARVVADSVTWRLR